MNSFHVASRSLGEALLNSGKEFSSCCRKSDAESVVDMWKIIGLALMLHKDCDTKTNNRWFSMNNRIRFVIPQHVPK